MIHTLENRVFFRLYVLYSSYYVYPNIRDLGRNEFFEIRRYKSHRNWIRCKVPL